LVSSIIFKNFNLIVLVLCTWAILIILVTVFSI
jgi:hypothetical protein